jgi:hypothetical protein
MVALEKEIGRMAGVVLAKTLMHLTILITMLQILSVLWMLTAGLLGMEPAMTQNATVSINYSLTTLILTLL